MHMVMLIDSTLHAFLPVSAPLQCEAKFRAGWAAAAKATVVRHRKTRRQGHEPKMGEKAMTKKLFRLLVATTALASAMPAYAQSAAAADEASADNGDIIVTARRSDEKLQDVPVSVQVVTGDTIHKLAITSTDELSKLAPGLNLTNQGASTIVTLRGVTWQPGSGTPATPIYYNEAPFDPEQTIQSIFDVGQVEVLRGPQGTSRGAPSISGAVTITTRKPDLTEFGGYVQGAYGTAKRWNAQGAVNVPIIKDVLAVRLAAFAETNENNRVYSVKGGVDPKYSDRTLRASVLFKPTDTLSIGAMYQRRKTERLTYDQVDGTGSPGFAALGIPANFNGPALAVGNRASVETRPSQSNQHVDLLTVNAAWEVFGHKLTYNFGRQFTRTGPYTIAIDSLNILPGFDPVNTVSNQSLPRFSTNEIRISSLPSDSRPFDYDIGWFSKHSGGTIIFDAPNFLPGAFGAPFQSIPGQVTTPNQRYVLGSSTAIGLGQTFDSFYGNVRFHIDDRTELSGGLAIVRDRVTTDLQVTLDSGKFAALPIFLPPPSGCQGIPPAFFPFVGIIYPSPVYGPAYCEAAVNRTIPRETHNDKYTDALYNFSLSHKFTDDLLVYATTGTSFRTGLPAINNPGLPSNLLVPAPEKATSYEIGVKSSFGRKLRANASVFQLNYKGQLTRFEGVNYFNTTSAAVSQTGVAFYSNVDSRVRGFELEVAAEPIDHLSLGASLSYSKITSKGGLVPCNDATRPITAANPINTCPSLNGEVLNSTAPFQATFNGGYEASFSDSFGGYFRFNLNYQGNNPNYGNFRTGGAFKSTPAYAIVDLFAGITGKDGAWEIGAYAKNVFDKQPELARVLTINSVFPLFAAPSGYDQVRLGRPREIGVTARFSFGSR
jgi:iron complex outermembrane recepter protein